MKSYRAFAHFMLLFGLAILVLPTLADARGRGFRNDSRDADAFSVRGRQRGEGVIIVREARGGRVSRVILFPQSLRMS